MRGDGVAVGAASRTGVILRADQVIVLTGGTRGNFIAEVALGFGGEGPQLALLARTAR